MSILRLEEIFEDKDRFYVVTDLCQGGELFDVIQSYAEHERHMPEHITSPIIEQVLSAVCYLHQRNFIHMDLKPENILFESKNDNSIKLVDFFFAQAQPGAENPFLLDEVEPPPKKEE